MTDFDSNMESPVKPSFCNPNGYKLTVQQNIRPDTLIFSKKRAYTTTYSTEMTETLSLKAIIIKPFNICRRLQIKENP